MDSVLAGGLFLIGGTGLGFVGQQFITAGVAAIIFSLSPIVTGVLAWPLLPEERLEGRDYLGVLLGFVGIAVVIRPDPATLLDPEVVGKLLFFAGVAVVALGTVLVRRSRPTIPVPALTGWAMVIGGTVHVVFAIAVGESVASTQPTPLAVATVDYLGLVVGAVGLVTYLALMGEVGALKASLTTYLTPVVAIGIGWLLLDERIQPLALVGFGIIVAGFALLESRKIAAELAKYRSLYR
ncbi:DMT family transporter [Halapricum hydrolyticum]|uniref:DMT family transporter n=1 Tax=Halapricum hydrolyticum TaxID=2979991 RepID=A0AAE3ICS4_9EURY|nr:DMT family transporter [Halapricum hydrolyticum]MCU4728218.1 DMT family transporter [Halapricum hydrolyticum]